MYEYTTQIIPIEMLDSQTTSSSCRTVLYLSTVSTFKIVLTINIQKYNRDTYFIIQEQKDIYGI